MTLYHTDKNGSPAICKAQPGKCPLGQHASSIEEMQKDCDYRNESLMLLSSVNGDVSSIKGHDENPYIQAERTLQEGKKYPLSQHYQLAYAQIMNDQYLEEHIKSENETLSNLAKERLERNKDL